jgi:hypothetical protein
LNEITERDWLEIKGTLKFEGMLFFFNGRFWTNSITTGDMITDKQFDDFISWFFTVGDEISRVRINY